MDALMVSKKIYEKIKELDAQKDIYIQAVTRKVNAQVEYDKALAVEIIKLRAYTPVSIVDKIAKGNITDKTLELELSEGLLKAVESNTRSILAQLNGFQSINKFFSEI